MTSCKDDTTALSASYAKFNSGSFNAPYSGKVNIYVEWSETRWEITKSEGDVIASLSETSGGNTTDKDQKTTIVVGLNENTSKSAREQQLTIKNLTTGETSRTVVKQGMRNASVSFLETQKTVNYLGGTVKVTVVSSEAEWELVLAEGDLINGISPSQGGDATKTDMATEVEISYNANTSEDEPNSQKIYLVNKADDSRSEFTLLQEAKYAKVASAIFSPSAEHQYVEGFGGMYPPKGWVSDPIEEQDIRKMFGSSEGQLGYNILRLMIYDKHEDWDFEMDNARLAQTLGAKIFACPWYCPIEYGEDKTDKNGDKYRMLYKEHWEDYARHLAEYVNYVKGKGVNLHAVSVQNEPDMHFTYWDENGSGSVDIASFVSQYGGVIRATGVKLMSPEACGYQLSYNNAVKNDPGAWANTDIMAGHLYQGFIPGDTYVNQWTLDNGKKLRDYFADWNSISDGKQWWMTEHLFNDGEKETAPSSWAFQSWEYNLSHLAKEIHYCMAGNCSAYVYWYLKRFYGLIGDNDPRSPVAEGEVSKNGYIMSHYAKYAKESTRIDLKFNSKEASDDDKILGTAYKQGNSITFVILNTSDENTAILISGDAGQAFSTSSAVITDETKNMEKLSIVLDADKDELTVPVPKRSIVSVRIGLEQ